MTHFRRRMGVVPPFLAGVSAALAVEISAGLLLYADEGLLPALTLILTVEVGALGLGLWVGSLDLWGGVVEHVRRRWLFCLIVFAVAAALSAGLEFVEGLSVTGLGQGLGLGFLGGLPLFSIGALLGAVGNPGDMKRGVATAVWAPSVLGAAVGFWLAGTVLIPNVAPYSVYLASLVLLSGGALLHGWVLDSHPVIEVLKVGGGPVGEVRIEKRASGSPRRQIRVLLEAGRLRGGEDEQGNPVRSWERGVLELWKALPRPPDSVLYLGGGSGTLVRKLSDLRTPSRLQVVERSRDLVSFAREHLESWEGWGDLSLSFGELLDPGGGPSEPFETVVVDCEALPSFGGVPFLGEADWRVLSGSVEAGGVLILGGVRSREGFQEEALRGLLTAGDLRFQEMRVFQEAMPSAEADLLGVEREGASAFLVLSKTRLVLWPESVLGFRQVGVGED